MSAATDQSRLQPILRKESSGIEDGTTCSSCQAKFTVMMLTPRHRCRACQTYVCHACSPNVMLIANQEESGPQRVCTRCVRGAFAAYAMRGRLAVLAEHITGSADQDMVYSEEFEEACRLCEEARTRLQRTEEQLQSVFDAAVQLNAKLRVEGRQQVLPEARGPGAAKFCVVVSGKAGEQLVEDSRHRVEMQKASKEATQLLGQASRRLNFLAARGNSSAKPTQEVPALHAAALGLLDVVQALEDAVHRAHIDNQDGGGEGALRQLRPVRRGVCCFSCLRG